MVTSRLDDIIGTFRGSAGETIEVPGNPFALRHSIYVGADPCEISAVWPDVGCLPPQVAELWTATRSARLFEDTEYGQWGLEVLSPAAARDRTTYECEWRADGVIDGDIVIGAFLGDQELVVVAHDGDVLIALPLDPRADWFRPAPSLAEFLEAYHDADGAKFWE